MSRSARGAICRRITLGLALLALVPAPAAASGAGWTNTGSLGTARYYHSATTLLDGRVLVAGGFDPAVGNLASAELYDPATGVWTPTESMAQARYVFTGVLVVGGYNHGALAGAELGGGPR